MAEFMNVLIGWISPLLLFAVLLYFAWNLRRGVGGAQIEYLRELTVLQREQNKAVERIALALENRPR